MNMGKNCNSYRALIRDFICSPYFKDKPIYGKPMEYWSSGNVYSESEKALSQDKEWQRYTTQINNSPSNLRRLFISKEYLVLQHYVQVPNVKYTTQKALLWCVKTEDYCRSRGYTNFQANTDSILLCLDDRWKQANIEEVYVDELFLTQQQQQANKRVVQQLMSYSDAGGKVFPRFKAVYYVPQLGTQLLEAIKKMDKGELPYKAFVGMKVIQKQTPQWGRFSLRPSDYIFDKKGGKLDQYAQQIIELEKAKLQEAKKIALQQKFTEQEKEQEQEKGKLEEIFETLDEKFIKEILFEGFSTEQKAEVIQEFTAQGKKKYGSLLELKEG